LGKLLQARVEIGGQSPLIAHMQSDKDHWRECSRHFIVPDYWPGTATPSRNT
jgi:hypothetical protein